MVRHP